MTLPLGPSCEDRRRVVADAQLCTGHDAGASARGADVQHRGRVIHAQVVYDNEFEYRPQPTRQSLDALVQLACPRRSLDAIQAPFDRIGLQHPSPPPDHLPARP